MDGGRRGEWIWCPSSIEGKADGHFFERRPTKFGCMGSIVSEKI